MPGPSIAITGEGVLERGWVKAPPQECQCWDCIRARGITPKKKDADKHRDIHGNIYNVVTGRIDGRKTKAEKEEARMHKTANVASNNRPEKG